MPKNEENPANESRIIRTRELHRFFDVALDFGHTPLLLVPEKNQKLLISRNEEDYREIVVEELIE